MSASSLFGPRMDCTHPNSSLPQTRKPASCPRCKTIMYPGPTGSPENHKRGYCSDGVRSKPPDNTPPGYLPPWPQPHGVFSSDASGTTFNPIPFLATLRDIYEKAVLGGRRDDEVDAMEFGAFAEMLHSRIRPQGPRRWCRSLSTESRIRARFVSREAVCQGGLGGARR